MTQPRSRVKVGAVGLLLLCLRTVCLHSAWRLWSGRLRPPVQADIHPALAPFMSLILSLSIVIISTHLAYFPASKIKINLMTGVSNS
jgi:hypothetical protein